MRSVWAGWFMMLALMLGGCSASTPPSPPRVKIDRKRVEANVQFGFRLLHELDERREVPNLFFSPLSVSLALTMVLNGARGTTYQQMADALGYGEQPLDAINAENALLLHLLRSPDPKTETLIANSLWVQQGFSLLPSFVQACQKHYEAEVNTVDFIQNSEDAAQLINNWVKRNTKGLILELFKPDDFNWLTRLVVVNTLYFKGKWQKRFDKQATKEWEFRLEDGTAKRVPMMHQSGEFNYLRGDGFQAVALPYGEGDLSFYLFLPDEGRSLNEFLKELTLERWKEWLKRFKPMEGEVGLPRFRIEATYSLKEPLKALGMTDVFDEGKADLSGIAPEHLFIHKVQQKAVVEVDEEGTKAAATTGVIIGIVSLPNRFALIADHPFFFTIQHNATGAILFMGVVQDAIPL